MDTVTRLYEALFLVDSGQAAADWDIVMGAINKVLDRAGAEVVEIKLTNEKLDNKKVKDVGLPVAALIGVIYRNGEVIICTEETILKIGDILTVITKTEVIQDVTDILK